MGTRADVEEMRRLLRYANLAKIAEAVGVSRATVSEWSRGNDVSPYRVGQVRALIEQSLGQTKEAPPAEADGALTRFMERWESPDPPPWAKGLSDHIVEEVREMITGDGDGDRESLIGLLAERLEESLAAPRTQSGEAVESDPESDPGDGSQQVSAQQK